jgi:diguanylate cyclase (GGDEF)-like protein
VAAVAPAALDFTEISLIVQWVGILVVGGLLLFLTQSIRSRALDAWAAAWCCLAAALGALYADFRQGPAQHAIRALYFLGEYGFGFLLLAGCHAFASTTAAPDGTPAGVARPRRAWLWLPTGLAVAVGLTWVSDDFNVQFSLHAAIIAGFLLAAFFTLLPARGRHGGPGLTVLCAALFLLALDFCHYVPVFAVAAARGASRRFAYLNYTSSVDLILEIVLGFGVVMVTMESLRRDSERANRELQHALGRLEVLASTDPLTSALNRHAFQSLVAVGEGGDAAGSELAGCVAVADVNRLKQINDRAGHLSGDLAIRRVATAIRSVIRADDLLFRWGGDEFLVILRQVDEGEAHRRFARVNELLAGAAAEACQEGEPPLSVSFGIAPFGRAAALEAAIERADAVMYEGKRAAAAAGPRSVR